MDTPDETQQSRDTDVQSLVSSRPRIGPLTTVSPPETGLTQVSAPMTYESPEGTVPSQ